MAPSATPKRKHKQPPQQQQQQQQHLHQYQHQHQQQLPVPIPQATLDNSDEARNLRVLQHYYPDTRIVIHVAPFSTLQIFKEKNWTQTSVEGPLFITNLAATKDRPERFSLVILSRRGLDQISIELTSPSLIETEQETILLSTDREEDDHYGVWVYSELGSSTEHMLEATKSIIMECAKRSEASFLAAQSAKIQNPTRSLSLLDIFSQQREADAGFGLQSHGENDPSISPQQASPQVSSAQQSSQLSSQPPAQPQLQLSSQLSAQQQSQPLFQTNADTDFFRSVPNSVKPVTQQNNSNISSISNSTSLPNSTSISVQDLFRQAQNS